MVAPPARNGVREWLWKQSSLTLCASLRAAASAQQTGETHDEPQIVIHHSLIQPWPCAGAAESMARVRCHCGSHRWMRKGVKRVAGLGYQGIAWNAADAGVRLKRAVEAEYAQSF